jgi:hypothetical protein
MAVDYSNIENPYDTFVDRSIENQYSPSPDQPIRDGDSFKDVWIQNFIKSENWKPKSAGFYIDGQTGYAEFSNVYVSGEIEALTGTIGGFNIGSDYLRDAANSFGLASTVSGSDDVRFWAGDTFANRATAPFRITESGILTVKKSTDNQRVILSGADGTLVFHSPTAEVISIGSDTSRGINITGNATVVNGVYFAATTAGNGFYYTSSSNIAGNAFRADILGATASTVGLFVDHDGSTGYGIDINTSAGAVAARLIQGSTSSALDITKNGTTGKAISILMGSGTTGGAIDIDLGSTTQSGLTIYGTTTGDAASVSITNTSASAAGIFIDKNNTDAAIEIDQDANSASHCFGIVMNIDNAGAGLEYAFDFAGAEIVNAAVGGTQDWKIRVRVSGVTYFIPCYTT